MRQKQLEAHIAELEAHVAGLEATVKELAGRVQAAEDVKQIQELQYRYLNALMATEWDVCADCFAEDALVDVHLHDPVRGQAAIREWFRGELSKTHAGKEGDVCIHPIVTVDGDQAKGDWLLYMMYFYPRTGQSLFWVQGRYDMDYVRENGSWKIAVMRWEELLGLPGGGPPTGLW